MTGSKYSNLVDLLNKIKSDLNDESFTEGQQATLINKFTDLSVTVENSPIEDRTSFRINTSIEGLKNEFADHQKNITKLFEHKLDKLGKELNKSIREGSE